MERFTFMALVKSVGTKQKGDGKETEVRTLFCHQRLARR